jgi:hypothetical protein
VERFLCEGEGIRIVGWGRVVGCLGLWVWARMYFLLCCLFVGIVLGD